MRDITPESIITVTAFRDETVDMRIPFKIPAKVCRTIIKPGVKFLCLFILENIARDNTGDGMKETVKERAT